MRADFTSHYYPSHTHDAVVIAVTEAGGAEVSSRSTMEIASPSVLFVSNPEERQSARMGDSPRWRYRSMYLARPAIDAVAQGLGIESVPYFTRNLFAGSELVRGFGQLHQTLEMGDDGFLEHQRLIAMFGALFGRHGSGGSRVEPAPHDRILAARVVDMMRERYAENLCLPTLANTAGLTTFQLIGLFRRTFGLTPHAYLIRVRLNVACRFLRRGHALAESAQAAGFCDQSALSRHFKRWFGITPLQFAAAARPRRSVGM